MNGQRYRNKHNGREVTIVEGEMMDTGDMIYKCCDDDTGKVDWTGDYTLKEHWVELGSKNIPITDSLHAAPITDAQRQTWSRLSKERLLDEICSLKSALALALGEPNDACDTHSQHLNTSGKEE